MTLISSTLEARLKVILENGFKSAYQKTMEVGFNENADAIKISTADAFGKEAGNMAKDIANAITDYIKTGTIQTIVTTSAGGGTGQGTIS